MPSSILKSGGRAKHFIIDRSTTGPGERQTEEEPRGYCIGGEKRKLFLSIILCAQVKVHLMASSASLSTALPIKQQGTVMNNEQ